MFKNQSKDSLFLKEISALLARICVLRVPAC